MELYREKDIRIRPAAESDIPTILKFILELAEFEGAADQINSTEEGLYDVLFVRHGAEAII